MNEVTQENRRIRLDSSPLGKDVLLLTSISGEEQLSRLFDFELELLSSNHAISARDIVGQPVTFSVHHGAERVRYFNGVVNRFSASRLTINDLRGYRAQVVPWLWFLTRTSDCRIFQKKSIPDIIEEIFADFGFADYEIGEVKGDHQKWDYCVQYRETAFNFISRLMEQEGIFYWFRHEQDKHILVLADQNGAFKDLPEKEVEYMSDGEDSHVKSRVTSWDHQYAFVTGRCSQSDYNFKTPSTNLQTSTPSVVEIPNMSKFECFDYPGEYAERDSGESLTKLRMEEVESEHDVVTAAGNCRSFAPGGKFTLTRHEFESEKKTYVITSISHGASDTTYIAGASAGQNYTNEFTCIPADVAYRPSRMTSKPTVWGPQTAVVVGPPGEEIYTDEHGRVKVQFHWDRYGKRDADSSCWIRVSQVHAGKGFGGIDVPRIGEEAIVEFLEGDPDQPIVTGRVYNGENAPPNGLPGAKMISGLKSNSTPGGGGNNAIMLDDTKGNELIRIHGQFDMDSTIDNDLREHVLNDRSRDVANNETLAIGNDQGYSIGNNQTGSVGADKTVTVGSNHSETIASNQTISIGSNKTETVKINTAETIGVAKELTIGGAYQVTVGAAMNETIGAAKAEEIGAVKSVNVGGNSSENIGANKSVDAGGNISESAGGNISEKADKDVTVTSGKKMIFSAGDDYGVQGKKKGVIEITDELTIKCGKAMINMKKNGDIIINGKKLTIKGSGDVIIKGSKILEN